MRTRQVASRHVWVDKDRTSGCLVYRPTRTSLEQSLVPLGQVVLRGHERRMTNHARRTVSLVGCGNRLAPPAVFVATMQDHRFTGSDRARDPAHRVGRAAAAAAAAGGGRLHGGRPATPPDR